MGCDLSFISKIARKGDMETDADGNEIVDKKILLLGLDGAGKTSLLLQFKENQFSTTVPTIGLNVEQLRYRSYMMTMWDVGGQATKLWKHYFDHIDGIIFVVDSCATDKYLTKTKNELNKISNDEALKNVPVLILVNK